MFNEFSVSDLKNYEDSDTYENIAFQLETHCISGLCNMCALLFSVATRYSLALIADWDKHAVLSYHDHAKYTLLKLILED